MSSSNNAAGRGRCYRTHVRPVVRAFRARGGGEAGTAVLDHRSLPLRSLPDRSQAGHCASAVRVPPGGGKPADRAVVAKQQLLHARFMVIPIDRAAVAHRR